MNQRLSVQQIIEQIATSLPNASWQYDPDADDMEITLPGGADREGKGVLLKDDLLVRLDPDTNEPLTITVTAWTQYSNSRTAQEAARRVASQMGTNRIDPQHWATIPDRAAIEAVTETMRSSTDLYTAITR
jgi:hypothetical protein